MSTGLHTSPRRIEFAGIPGAGKTTLCREILSQMAGTVDVYRYEDALTSCLRKRDRGGVPGKIVKMLPEAFWKPVVGFDCSVNELHAFQLRHIDLMRQIFENLTICDMDERWRECVLYVFIRLGVGHELLRSYGSPSSTVFVEEGFVQATTSAFGYLPLSHEFSDADIERYIENCPLPDDVIWLNTPVDVCLSRLADRPEYPVAVDGPDRDLRLSCFHRCLERAMEHLSARGVRLHRIDLDLDRNVTAAEQARLWIDANM